MLDIENPMVIDSIWDELDQIDQEEDFYIRADMEYEDDVDDRLSFYEWSRENDGYVL